MDFEEIASILNSRDLKSTGIRKGVLQIINNSEKAVAQTEIEEQLGNFDRVTLYRTLNILVEKGILHKAFTEQNETYFAMCSSKCSSQKHQHNHIHFKCSNCGVVSCQQPDVKTDISIAGFDLQKIRIEAEGICQNCSMA